MTTAERGPLSLPDGRILLPDNRWDLAPESSCTPSVSVVVPYYNQPRQLALVLKALTLQTYPRHLLDVVIADDGSAEAPDVADFAPELAVSVVRQEDKGFRAAAARNLGAAASTGTILCFLDADTVPCPDYIEHAVRLPSLVPDAVVVGRRTHADLSQLEPRQLAPWFGTSAEQLEPDEPQHCEPQWLVDAYRRTGNLLDPGWDGYKFILSAVLTCTREMFDAAGGFDPSFVRYGGEDWEFANRAFMMGAVLAHEPAARAWHDGPDWAGRAVADRTDEKNAEALALAPLITDPAARRSGLRYRVPDFVVLVRVDGHTAASLQVTVASVVEDNDSAVWFVGDRADSMYDALGLHDSRVRAGSPDEWILSRCRFVVELSGRVTLSANTLLRLANHVSPGAAGEVSVDFDTGAEPAAGEGAPSLRLRSSRALHRSRRWARTTGMLEQDVIGSLFGCIRVHADEVGSTLIEKEPWLSW
ncbi:MAG: glycosyltransferase [Rhodococcus sp. (in: high G+C Gram-positive bacteria)]